MTNELNTTTATIDTINGSVDSQTAFEETAVSPYAHILPTERSTIWVNRDEHEGILPLMVLGNGSTCKVPTESDPLFSQVPDWALNDQITGANLAERRDFYVERIGEEGYRNFRDTEVVNFNDIEMTAWDAEDNEVTISANKEWRMEELAEDIGLDLSVGGFDSMAETHGAIEENFTMQDATTPPTDEILEGVHETIFGEADQSASQKLRVVK